MENPGYITFKVYLQVYGGRNKPLEYQLIIKSTSVHALAKHLNLAFVPEIIPQGNVCMAENLEVRPEFRQTISKAHLRNFLYALLHSSIYETARKTLLQCDFSGFYFPGKAEDFWTLVNHGENLIWLHATGISGSFGLEAEFSEDVSFMIDPSKIRYEAESQKIWINNQQYFSNVPAHVWEYKTGGLQPLPQWLLMRAGHDLKNEEFKEFRALISLIRETNSLSRKIDAVFKFFPSPGNS
jgi:hypothetical protein